MRTRVFGRYSKFYSDFILKFVQWSQGAVAGVVVIGMIVIWCLYNLSNLPSVRNGRFAVLKQFSTMRLIHVLQPRRALTPAEKLRPCRPVNLLLACCRSSCCRFYFRFTCWFGCWVQLRLVQLFLLLLPWLCFFGSCCICSVALHLVNSVVVLWLTKYELVSPRPS